MREHELRRQVVSEMHLRRWPLVSVPGQVLQWVLMVEEAERPAEQALLAQLPRPAGQAASADAASTAAPLLHKTAEVTPGVTLAWERHSEGSSLALFAREGDEGLEQAVAWARGHPGTALRATRITLVADDEAAAAILPQFAFAPGETVSCLFFDRARLWADFRIKEDGFGHVLIAANGTDPRDLTRAVQQLQDLGNYRNRALLGLPVAKAAWAKLDEAEARLSDLARRVAQAAAPDDELMEGLTALSIELTAIASEIGYRLGATAAYAELVEERLAGLSVRPIDGYASLVHFTQRRFRPAVRTCASVSARQRQLSARAGQLASLLRTRIETRIERQNASLLGSMERSAKLQLRLQQLVEGLSVVALSYYLIGLLGYVLKAAGKAVPGLNADLALGALVIPVMAGIWFALHRLKARLLGPGHG